MPVSVTSNRSRTCPASRAVTTANIDEHVPRVGELGRVGHQIGQNLPQVSPVAVQSVRDVRVDVSTEAQTLSVRLKTQDRNQIGKLGMQIKIVKDHRNLAGFDPGQVQDIVDQGQERPARRLDRMHHVPLIAIQTRSPQQIACSDDRIQRRAQLVAHGCQETAFRLVRLLGLGLGFGQLINQRRSVTRKNDERRQQSDPERPFDPPEIGCHDDSGKADNRDNHRRGQVREAVTEAIAESHPEVNWIQRRGRLAPEVHQI